MNPITSILLRLKSKFKLRFRDFITMFSITYMVLLLIFLALMACKSTNESKDDKPIDQKNRDINYEYSVDDGTVLLLYKFQKHIASSAVDSLTIKKLILDSIYKPNERLFNYCLGYEKEAFIQKYSNALMQNSDSIITLVQNYEKLDLDDVIINTMREIAEKSIFRFEGRYVIGFFEDAGCIMCGCDNSTMLGNTYNKTYSNPEALKVVIAHEINHNFFELAKTDDPDKNTVLYNAIDEGFANLFSMEAINVGRLAAFNMSEKEFEWLKQHENQLKDKFSKVLFSKAEEDWNPYSEKIPNRIIEGSPGDVGYFLGYRIIEEWLSKNSNRKWHDVYSTPVRQILEESEYLN